MKTPGTHHRRNGLLVCVMVAMCCHTAYASLPAAPDPVPGGQASETRSITTPVERIVISGPVELSVRPSAKTELIVKGDPRLVPRVTTRTEGKNLLISTRGIFVSVNRHETARIELQLPQLAELVSEASGDVTIRGFEQEKMEIRLAGAGQVLADGNIQQLKAQLTGSGNLNLSIPSAKMVDLYHAGSGNAILKGRTRQIQVKLQGSGDVNAASLETRILTVDSSGSGNAHVCAAEEASVTISGNGDVTVIGRPPKRHIERKAQGDLIWK